VRGKFAEGLAVRYNGSGCISLNCGSVETENAQEKRDVFLNDGGNTEMFCYWMRWESIE